MGDIPSGVRTGCPLHPLPLLQCPLGWNAMQKLLSGGTWGAGLGPEMYKVVPPSGEQSLGRTVLPSPGATPSLLGFLYDGAHSRDDGGLGAAGTCGDSDDGWQGGRGGENGGLCYRSYWDGGVPLALSLLGICNSCAGSSSSGGCGIGCGAFLGARHKFNFGSFLFGLFQFVHFNLLGLG